MRKLKLFFACLLMAVLSIGQVWGENYNETISLSEVGEMLGGSYTSASGYWKVPETAGNNGTITIPSTYFTNQPTSDVTLTLHVATFGQGTNPSGSTVTITATGAEAGTNWTTSSYTGSLPSSSSYTDIILTLSRPTNPTTLGGVVITLGVNSSIKIFRLQTIGVAYEYSAATCNNSISIAKSSTTPTHGTFVLSNSGDDICIDSEKASTTVTATPDSHYHLASVTSTGGGSIGIISNNTCEITGIDADTEIGVSFEEDVKHTVTWNNHGITSTSQVYDGEKPVFPTPNPTSCDATSTTFIGWATTAWDGKLANTDGKTVYTSASAMPDVTGAVTYYAVYAKATAGTPVPHDGPSFSRSSSSNTITSGYTFTSSASANTDNYQDQSTVGNTSFVGVYHTTSAIFSSTPNSILVTAKIGGGTGNRDLANPVCAQLLDDKGAPIGQAVEITSHITTNTGDDYVDIEIPTTGITSANGVRISHVKESGYNVRFYSFSLSYTTGGTTYSDYMTTCAAAGTCEAPSFTPAAGTFNGAQDIELQTSTPSAHIYYTLDGSDPDDGSDEYTTAIHITQNTKIKAITYADGLNESTISEGDFNIRYAQPTLTASAAPVDGKYTSAITVTLAAEGADAIYYAIGETPTIDEEHKYTDPIALSTTGSKTINAIAVKAGYANSNVASATYVMDLPYGSIAEFVTAKPNTAKDLVFEEADNCVITGINGKSVYVQDASGKGMIIYNNSGYGALEFHVGDRIVGTVNGKYQAFNGQHEMSLAVFAEGVTFTAVSRPTPVSVTAIDETAFNANTQILVKIEDLYYKSSSDKTHKFAKTAGGSTEYTIYDQFGMLSGKTMPETSVACDLIGILSVYNSTYQLLPVLVSDIAADEDAANPTVSPTGGADAENAVTAAAVEITAAANTKVDGLASKTVDINSAIPTEVTVEVTRDFYRSVNFSCGWYKAAAAKYNINGQGATPEGEVVAKVADVEAATAAEGDEVHVFITPNAHFHFESITINKNEGTVATTQVAEGTEYSFTMPDEAVTIAVTYTQDQQATLTFAKGEATGTEDAPTAITDYVGETVQLPANPFTYSGHKFIGWSCDGGATKLAAGTDYELAENKAFVAYWEAIPTFNDADHEWQLVTSESQLVAGKYYVIAYSTNNHTMKYAASGSYYETVSSTIADGVIAYNALGANTAIFGLSGNSTAWTLTEVNNDVELGATTGKSMSWGTNTSWTIDIDENNASIANTNQDCGVIMYNNSANPKRFKVYASTSTMPLPQLYVWAEKVYKLRYDANGGEDAPDAQPAVNGEATVTNDQPTKEDKIFNGWNTTATGDGANKAAGDIIDLSSADVTLFAQWRDPESVTISYDANGGDGSIEADENQVEGTSYTIKANEFTREGYNFAGWKAYNAAEEELEITNGQFTVPATNVTVKAQWAVLTVTDFVLVTDINQLKDGDKVYVVAAGYDKAMGTQNGTTYRNEVAIAKDNNHILLAGTAPVEFTLGKDGNKYTFSDETGYLYAAGTANSGKNYLDTKAEYDAACDWNITIDENGTVIKSVANDYTPYMQFNNGSHRFACYHGATMQAIVLYKKLETIREDGVAPGVWGTICPKNEIVNAEGASFFQISYVEYHSGVPYKVFYDEIAEGENLVAGQPYLFLADENATAIKGFKVGNDATSATNDHGFIGVLENKTISVVTADVENYRYYIVYNNEIRLCGVGQFLIKAERAYLDMSDPNVEKQSKAPIAGRRRVALTNNAVQNATGCENINASETPVKMIIDGQLYILRGEKMYDATGKLVK